MNEGTPHATRGTFRIEAVAKSPAIAVLVGNVGLIALTLGTAVLAARVLGVNSRGQFVAGQTVASLTGLLLTLGIPQTVVVTADAAERLFWTIVLLLMSALACGTLLASALWWSGTFEWINPLSAVGIGGTATGLMAASIAAGWAQRLGAMRGLFQFVRLAPVLAVLLVMGVLTLIGSTDARLWLFCCGSANFAVAVTQLVILLARDAKGRPAGFPSRSFVRSSLTAWVLAAGSTMLFQADALIVAVTFESNDVALFAVGTGAAAACASLGNASGMIVFSQLRHAVAHSRWQIMLYGLVRALVISSFLAGIAWALGRTLVETFYGNEFILAVEPLKWLVVGSVPLSATYLLIHAVLVLGGRRQLLMILAVLGSLYVGALIIAAELSQDLRVIAWIDVGTYSAGALATFSLLWRLNKRGAGVLASSQRLREPGTSEPPPRQS